MAKGNKKAELTYMGYAVSEKYNCIRLFYDKEEYIKIIQTARAINMKPQDYVKLISQPCQSCGSSGLIIDKLTTHIKKKTYTLRHKQLFVFLNTDVHALMDKTDLSIDYIVRTIFNVPEGAVVYTPVKAHHYKDQDCEAILTIFSNNEVHTITNVVIKNSKIYSK